MKKLDKKQVGVVEKILVRFRQWQSKGLSMLIAVLMVTVVVLFSVGVTTVVTDSVRQAGNVKQGTTAYYAAEQGMEQALWLNQNYAKTSGSVGISKTLASAAIASDKSNIKTGFKISGTATTELVANKVNGKYIVPFPWTGNVPWHGAGSNPDGGCNPQKPPVRLGTGDSMTIGYPADLGVTVPNDYEKDHPCNWNMLKVGEKATVPLYNYDVSSNEFKFSDFTLRVRMPCMGGKEMCNPDKRMDLNCWDKGDGEMRCNTLDQPRNKYYRGEIVLIWQINADETTGGTTSLIPNNSVKGDDPDYYKSDSSDLFENKINEGRNNAGKYFEILWSKTSIGKNIDTGTNPTIEGFLTSTINKPTLSLTVVSSLVGCSIANYCQNASDNPIINKDYKVKNIPYLEYQVVLNDATAATPPANQENVISAEGQSGPFNQTIQVKVPNDNSSLEYVIQQ